MTQNYREFQSDLDPLKPICGSWRTLIPDLKSLTGERTACRWQGLMHIRKDLEAHRNAEPGQLGSWGSSYWSLPGILHSKVVELHGHLNQWCLLPPRTMEGSGVQMGRRGQQGKGWEGHSSHCPLVENLPCGPRSRGVTAPSLLPQPHHCHCSTHLWASKELPWTPPSLPLSFLVISSNHLLLSS